jgi:hypothetical protein
MPTLAEPRAPIHFPSQASAEALAFSRPAGESIALKTLNSQGFGPKCFLSLPPARSARESALSISCPPLARKVRGSAREV